MPYLRISRPESGKTIVTFEIITFEFVKMQYFMFKKNILNLIPTLSYLGIFRLELENTIVIFEISTFKNDFFYNYSEF